MPLKTSLQTYDPESSSASTHHQTALVSRIPPMLPVLLILIGYESIFAFNFHSDIIIRITLGFALIFAIVFAAFYHGLKPALIVATFSNLYLIYAFSGPGRHLQPLSSMLDGEWLIALVFFGPALAIGYLRDRINELLTRERAARSLAEQGQAYLSAILEQLPVGVIIAQAPNGNITFGNHYLEQIFGHSLRYHDSWQNYPASLLADKHGQELDLRHYPLKQVIDGHTLTNQEFLYHQDGETQVLRISGTPIYGPGHRITAGVIIVEDMTQEKKALQRKDDFLSMVSHELKTPITALKAYTQMLHRQIDKNQANQLPATVAKVEMQIGKITTLINDMLNLAKTSSDELEFHFQPIDLSQLAREAIEDIGATGIQQHLILHAPANLPIQADRDWLRRLFINLLANAAKFSPPDSRIIVSIEGRADTATISVQDFGFGIPKAEQSRIFERFYKVAQDTTSSRPGLGIGLYLCAEITKRHHGHIEVKSRKNQGSTFIITLPVHQQTTNSHLVSKGTPHPTNA